MAQRTPAVAAASGFGDVTLPDLSQLLIKHWRPTLNSVLPAPPPEVNLMKTAAAPPPPPPASSSSASSALLDDDDDAMDIDSLPPLPPPAKTPSLAVSKSDATNVLLADPTAWVTPSPLDDDEAEDDDGDDADGAEKDGSNEESSVSGDDDDDADGESDAMSSSSSSSSEEVDDANDEFDDDDGGAWVDSDDDPDDDESEEGDEGDEEGSEAQLSDREVPAVQTVEVGPARKLALNNAALLARVAPRYFADSPALTGLKVPPHSTCSIAGVLHRVTGGDFDQGAVPNEAAAHNAMYTLASAWAKAFTGDAITQRHLSMLRYEFRLPIGSTHPLREQGSRLAEAHKTLFAFTHSPALLRALRL